MRVRNLASVYSSELVLFPTCGLRKSRRCGQSRTSSMGVSGLATGAAKLKEGMMFIIPFSQSQDVRHMFCMGAATN